MKNPILKIRDLSSGYNEKKVLKNVSMDVYPGEIVAVIGTSGCGKTTLLKHVIGLLNAQKGRIDLFNKNISDLTDQEYTDLMRRVGILFQNGALLNSISVGENVSIPLEQHTKLPPEIIEKIVKLKLVLVKLSYTYHFSPTELSGGMRKRVALARAIALDPELLFIDEPGAGLDPVTAKSLDDLLLSLQSLLGITLIVITHEVASIKRIAQKVCYLHNGAVLFFGSLNEALTSQIPEVKSFFETQAD